MKGSFMNIAKKVSLTLFGAALLCSSAMLAGDTNKTTLQLYDKVTVDGKPLNPGKYTVEWTGSGSSVQITILQGKQTVATTSGHLTEQPTPNTQDGYGSNKEADGSKTLTTIYANGKHYSLGLDQKEARQQSTTTNSK
jgi:hypothetical protein